MACSVTQQKKPVWANPNNTDPADHDYSRFYSVLLVNQSTVIGNEMCV